MGETRIKEWAWRCYVDALDLWERDKPPWWQIRRRIRWRREKPVYSDVLKVTRALWGMS